MVDFPARDTGRFHCLWLELHFDHYNNGRRQEAHPTITELPPHPQSILEIGKGMLWNKLTSVQNTGACHPGLGWICQVHLGLGSMSQNSAQILIFTTHDTKSTVIPRAPILSFVINAYKWLNRSRHSPIHSLQKEGCSRSQNIVKRIFWLKTNRIYFGLNLV